MEQKSSLPDRGPELPQITPASRGEVMPSAPTPEVQVGSAGERKEQQGEAVHASVSDDVAAAIQAPSVPQPVTSVAAADSDASTMVVDPPTIANDDDLIEKEWVEKAKGIIAETKDDPFRREQEVTKLQADYLFKRYGRELGQL